MCAKTRILVPPISSRSTAFRFQTIWRKAIGVRGPTSTVSIASIGKRVIVIHDREVVRLFNLASGEELSSLRLSIRAETTCAPKEHPGKLWLGRSGDPKGALLDPAAPTTVAAARPASCSDEASAPIGGFTPEAAAEDESDGIATGFDRAGSTTAMLVGFSPTKPRAIRWRRAFVPADPQSATLEEEAVRPSVTNGHAFATYKVARRQNHVIAVDTRTAGRSGTCRRTRSGAHGQRNSGVRR